MGESRITAPLLLIIVLAIFLGLLSGCGGGADRKDDANFRSGSEGINIRFMPNLPPYSIYDDQDLDVVIEIENKGTYDVGFSGDRVYLSGFDQNILTGISTIGLLMGVRGPLEGRDQYNTIGGLDALDFKGVFRDLRSRNIDKYQTTLLVTACYAYETIASINVCIDPDPFSPTSKNKVCIPQNAGGGTQGAPVAVTGVEVEANPRRTIFKIHVANVGGGDVFTADPTVLTKCNPFDPVGLEYDEVDRVRLDEVEISGTSILGSCRPLQDNEIRLTNGQGTVVCQLDTAALGSGSAFMTPLNIRLKYGYRTTRSQAIEVLQSFR